MRVLVPVLALCITMTSAGASRAEDAPLRAPDAPGLPARASLPPPEPVSVAPETELNSPGMVAGGTVLGVIGSVGAVLGIVAIADAAARESYGNPTSNLSMVVGGVLLGGGVSCIGGGIPLIVIGAEEVPVERPRGTPEARAALRVGAGSASLSWVFQGRRPAKRASRGGRSRAQPCAPRRDDVVGDIRRRGAYNAAMKNEDGKNKTYAFHMLVRPSGTLLGCTGGAADLEKLEALQQACASVTKS
jgi:hypothetical protein